jgi:uncharacterized membrane protein
MLLILVAILVGLALLLARTLRNDRERTNSVSPGTSRAAEILAERFARGEIGVDEFIQRRELLRSDSVGKQT